MALLLHPATRALLDQAVRHPAGSYAFHGAPHTGKASAALELAADLNPDSREQLAHGNHPNLIVVAPTDKASVSIEQIRALQSQLTRRSYSAAGQRVVVIDAADTLSIEAQNSLLKLIEEPPADTVLILVTQELTRLLVTVQSRVQAVFFPPVLPGDIETWLTGTSGVPGAQAAELAQLSGGAPGLALTLARDAGLLEAYRTYDALAAQLLEDPLFERLVAVRKLVDGKAPLGLVAERLQARVRTALRDASGPADLQADRLDALAHYATSTRANVTPRVAMERLMIEL